MTHVAATDFRHCQILQLYTNICACVDDFNQHESLHDLGCHPKPAEVQKCFLQDHTISQALSVLEQSPLCWSVPTTVHWELHAAVGKECT